MELPECTLTMCSKSCPTIMEHMPFGVSFCPKCSPVINMRRRCFDIMLAKEHRALTRKEVDFIVGMSKADIIADTKKQLKPNTRYQKRIKLN